MAHGERLADISTTEHLSNLAQAFGNTLERPEDLIAPVLYAPGEKFEYGEWSKGSGFQSPGVDENVPGTEAKEFAMEYSIKNDTCVGYAGRMKLPARHINQYAGPLSLLEVRTQQVTRLAFDSRKARIAAAIASGNCTYTAAAHAKWDAASGSAIFQTDLTLGVNSIYNQSGKIPNTIFMPWDVARALRNNSEFVSRYQYFADTVKSGALPDVIEDMKVVILKGRYNSAKKGQTASLASIFADNCWIAYIEPTPDPYSLTALATFRPETSKDITVEAYWDRSIKSYWVEYNLVEKVKLMNQECLYCISDCLT